MNELLNALTRADQICKEANKHYTAATEMQSQCDALEAKAKKSKWKWVGIGVAAYYLVQAVLGQIALLFGDNFFARILLLIVAAASIYVGVRVGRGGYKKEIRKVNAEIAKRQPQIQKEQAIGEQIFEDNINDMEFLPVDYWYPMATEYLVKVVRSQRANDLGTAIDKFEEQLHRWKIEEANAQMVEQQKIQSAHLKSIRRSSKISAAANVANAINNIANSF